MGCKKQGAKKRVIAFKKRRGQAASSLYEYYNDPVFLHPAFRNPYFGPFFQVHKPTHLFKTRIVGGD